MNYSTLVPECCDEHITGSEVPEPMRISMELSAKSDNEEDTMMVDVQVLDGNTNTVTIGTCGTSQDEVCYLQGGTASFS